MLDEKDADIALKMKFDSFYQFVAAFNLEGSINETSDNANYESGIAELGAKTWHVRTARTTPSKPGAFVAFWQRDHEGESVPFEDSSCGDGLLVFVIQGDHRGVFQFSNQDLQRLGITSGATPGKRGFRVYPPWCEGLNSNALKTQKQQKASFKEF